MSPVQDGRTHSQDILASLSNTPIFIYSLWCALTYANTFRWASEKCLKCKIQMAYSLFLDVDVRRCLREDTHTHSYAQAESHQLKRSLYQVLQSSRELAKKDNGAWVLPTSSQIVPSFSLLLIWLCAAHSYHFNCPRALFSSFLLSSVSLFSTHLLFSCLLYSAASCLVFSDWIIDDPNRDDKVLCSPLPRLLPSF